MPNSFLNAAAKRRFFSSSALAILALAGLNACSSGAPPALPNNICELALPPIGMVQGRAERSPLVDQEVTVRAVVTAVIPGSGFFVHDPNGDGDPTTSEGLWVADGETPPFPGELWAWRGKVVELDDQHGATLTALNAVSGRQKCAEDQTLPTADFPLPNSQREALESMHVSLPTNLQVSQPPTKRSPYEMQVASEMIFAPTEMVRPGAAAHSLQQRFAAASMQISLPPGRHDYRADDRLGPIQGVYDLREQAQLLASSAPQITTALATPPRPPPSPGTRLVSMNLLNYFNGDGRGGGFPTRRGAQSLEEFEQQRARIVAAISALDPWILAAQELENDGFGPYSAAQDLRQALNQAQAGADWQVVQPGSDVDATIGDDQITVALFYRADRVQPSGTPQLLHAGDFGTYHRPVLAQAFQWHAGQAPLLVASVHLKSKGGCPKPEHGENADESALSPIQQANLDQHDGQGCWNPMRTSGARQLAQWLKQQAGSGPALALGDFNSYRMEDPPRALIREGLVELVGESSEPPLFSYVYRGAHGSLDYAFATPDLLKSLVQVRHWPVNSQYSDLPAPETAIQPPWQRFSDHDPLWVDINP